MRPRSAAILACRIIALVLGIQAIMMTVSLLAFTRNLQGTGEFWAIVGAMAIIAWGLWIAAESVARAMARGAGDEAPAQPRSPANAHAVAFSVVGVIQIVEAIPSLIASALSEFGSSGAFGLLGFGGSEPIFDRGSAIAVGVVRLVLGFILIFGAGGLARASAGRYPEPEPVSGPPPA